VAHEVGALAHIGGLVERGHGQSILPLLAIRDELAAGKVSIARLGSGVFRRTLSLARNSSAMVTHASVRAEDLNVQVLARLIAKGAWRAEPAEGLRCPSEGEPSRKSRKNGD
jgi:LysR family nitrogen assimilation transcriptional regulator